MFALIFKICFVHLVNYCSNGQMEVNRQDRDSTLVFRCGKSSCSIVGWYCVLVCIAVWACVTAWVKLVMVDIFGKNSCKGLVVL